MKYFLLTAFLFPLVFQINAQNYEVWLWESVDLKLQNNKTGKVKTLSGTKAAYTNISSTLKSNDTIQTTRDVTGKIIEIDQQHIILQPTSDYYNHFRSSMGSQQIWNNYGFFEKTDPVRLKKNKVSEVAYQTRTAQTFESIGIAGGLLGLTTSLLVAPLASIQYRKGGFNKDRYFVLAGSGLAAATIGFTLVGIFDARRFQINPQFENGRNNWNFVQQ